MTTKLPSLHTATVSGPFLCQLSCQDTSLHTWCKMSGTPDDKTGNVEADFVPDGVTADTGNNAQDRSSLMKIIGKAIGLGMSRSPVSFRSNLDITTIAIPVTYNEPTSFLQRMMEFVQYWPLLVKVRTPPRLLMSIRFKIR